MLFPVEIYTLYPFLLKRSLHPLSGAPIGRHDAAIVADKAIFPVHPAL